MEPSTVQNAFLIGMSFVYMFAFSSLYYQVPGLYGDEGILPIRNKLNCDQASQWQCVYSGAQPGLLHLSGVIGLAPSALMELLCMVGCVLASLQVVFPRFRDVTPYALLWTIYFSCFQVGQTFLWFQWDTLLLEAGLLSCLVAPFRLFRRQTGRRWLPWDNVTLWLVRWLCFRLMFASGVVKLTTLNWHFESQCIPTPAAWYAHNLPNWLLRLGVVGTYVMELFIPFLFLAPLYHLRLVAFVCQVLFMGSIMITGNYNFFNILTVVISIPLLVSSGRRERSALSSDVLKVRLGWKRLMALKWLSVLGAYGLVGYYTVRLFGLRYDPESGIMESKVGFNKDDLYRTLAWSVPLIIVVAALLFASEVASAIMRCFTDVKSRFRSLKLLCLLQTLVVCAVAAGAFAVSLVPFSWLDRGAYDMLWPEIKELHQKSDALHMTHSYGLFRSMTGVGGRPELWLEAADEENGPWTEYDFLYKPMSLKTKPPFLIPHQPRLDWQMWFAALGSYQQNPWLLSLTYQLLKGSPTVLQLFQNDPYYGEKPKYVRAVLYLYHYTKYPKSGNRQYAPSAWWWKEYKREYMPPISLSNPSLNKVLKRHNLLVDEVEPEPWSVLSWFVEFLRACVLQTGDPVSFVWSVAGVTIVSKVSFLVLRQLNILQLLPTPEEQAEAEEEARKNI
jgi:hypothetical protein